MVLSQLKKIVHIKLNNKIISNLYLPEIIENYDDSILNILETKVKESNS